MVALLSLFLMAAAGGPAPRTLALTFDDLPGVGHPATLAGLRDANARLLAALRDAEAPAIGFVNEDKLQVDGERDARAAILASWLDAGQTLGNHTYAHKGLTTTPLVAYEEDVLRGDVVTRRLLAARGKPLAFFRHPYTQTGPTAEAKKSFEAFLATHGYRVAPFTIETADYVFAALYDDARAAGDAALARRIRDAYVAHQDVMTSYFEGLAKEAFSREIPQILLAHVNALNADAMPELLARFRARGYRFVTLEEALADPAYATPDRWIGKNGPSWLHRWRVAQRLPDRMRDEPDPPKWILDAYEKRAR